MIPKTLKITARWSLLKQYDQSVTTYKKLRIMVIHTVTLVERNAVMNQTMHYAIYLDII